MTKTQANIFIALLVVLIGAVVNNTRVVGKPSIITAVDGYGVMSDGRSVRYDGVRKQWVIVSDLPIEGAR